MDRERKERYCVQKHERSRELVKGEGEVILMILSWWSGSELGIGSVFLIGYGDDGDMTGWTRLGYGIRERGQGHTV